MEKKKENKRTEIKEIGRIALLDKLFENTGFKNSDSPTIKEQQGEEYTISSRLFLEGIDFDLTYTPLKYLGYKIVVSAVGGLYAKNCNPKGLNFNIALSAKFSYQHLQSLWDGVIAAAKEHKIESISLDLTTSLTGLIISCNSSGYKKQTKKEKIKSGALLCVTGNLGAGYMGLHVLEREKVAFNASKEYKQPDLSKYKYIIERYLTPNIDSDTVSKFEETSIFPLDGRLITRGLGDAVKQIAKESGMGAKIFIEKIPIASQTREMCEELGIDIITAVVNGGEDYRLLYVLPLENHDKIIKELKDLEIIGHLYSLEKDESAKDINQSGEDNCFLITPEGNQITITAQGW